MVFSSIKNQPSGTSSGNADDAKSNGRKNRIYREKAIFDSPKWQDLALRILEESPGPATAGYVAFHLGCHVITARNVLFVLAIQGKVHAERTTHNWVFKKKSEGNQCQGKEGQAQTGDPTSRELVSEAIRP